MKLNVRTENPKFSPEYFNQLPTILLLFISLRITILLFFTPEGPLNVYTDYYYYFRISQLSEDGYFPFINMWSIYPPISTYYVHSAYMLSKLFLPGKIIDPVGYQFYTRVLGALLLIFEAGVLILVHHIAMKVWNNKYANWIAWAYAGLSLPLFFWYFSHNVIMVFFFLLAVDRFIHLKRGQSSIALGMGISAKIIPITLFAPVTKFMWHKKKELILYFLIAGLTIILIYTPFILADGLPWIKASFTSLIRKGSYSTIWALIDGNWGGGDPGPWENRTQLDLANIPHATPTIIPEFIKIAIFGIIYLWIFRKPVDRNNPKHFIWFTTITLMIFYLWSKGWSPSWSTLVIPLLLLSLPNGRGLTLALLLTCLTFLEWPIANALNSWSLFSFSIICRTLLFIAIITLVWFELWKGPKKNSLFQKK